MGYLQQIVDIGLGEGLNWLFPANEIAVKSLKLRPLTLFFKRPELLVPGQLEFEVVARAAGKQFRR
jgi:hypothetical protein